MIYGFEHSEIITYCQLSWLTGSIFADPDHLSEGLSHGEAPPC